MPMYLDEQLILPIVYTHTFHAYLITVCLPPFKKSGYGPAFLYTGSDDQNGEKVGSAALKKGE